MHEACIIQKNKTLYPIIHPDKSPQLKKTIFLHHNAIFLIILNFNPPITVHLF